MKGTTEDLIREIAVKHGVAIGRDDPILILQTLNERLLEESAKSQQAILDTYKEEMEVLADRWGADIKDKAERILNAALTAAKDTLATMASESAKTTAASVRSEIDTALTKVAAAIRDARRIAFLNIFAACVALAAAAVAFWAVGR